jgi:hypothetical protein
LPPWEQVAQVLIKVWRQAYKPIRLYGVLGCRPGWIKPGLPGNLPLWPGGKTARIAS